MNMHQSFLTRREAISRCGSGFAIAGLASLLNDEGLLGPASAHAAATQAFGVKQPHFPPRARQVVQLFMNGGPSQVDTFDPKPLLEKYHGQPLPVTNLR